MEDGKFHKDNNVPSLYNSNPFDLISEYPKEMEVSHNRFKDTERRWIVSYGKRDFLDENGIFWKFAKDIEPEPPTIEITMSEAIEELKNPTDKYKNKNITIK